MELFIVYKLFQKLNIPKNRGSVEKVIEIQFVRYWGNGGNQVIQS